MEKIRAQRARGSVTGANTKQNEDQEMIDSDAGHRLRAEVVAVRCGPERTQGSTDLRTKQYIAVICSPERLPEVNRNSLGIKWLGQNALQIHNVAAELGHY